MGDLGTAGCYGYSVGVWGGAWRFLHTCMASDRWYPRIQVPTTTSSQAHRDRVISSHPALRSAPFLIGPTSPHPTLPRIGQLSSPPLARKSVGAPTPECYLKPRYAPDPTPKTPPSPAPRSTFLPATAPSPSGSLHSEPDTLRPCTPVELFPAPWIRQGWLGCGRVLDGGSGDGEEVGGVSGFEGVGRLRRIFSLCFLTISLTGLRSTSFQSP